jgi:hypothetical protein
MKYADQRKLAENGLSLFQIAGGAILLAWIVGAGTTAAQGLPQVMIESHGLATPMETQNGGGDLCFDSGAVSVRQESVAPGSIGAKLLATSETTHSRGFLAFGVDGCSSSSDVLHSSALQLALGSVGSPPTSSNDSSRENVKATAVEVSRMPKPDSSRDFYFKNRLEFSLDLGWLPTNIPFVFDVFLGDGYTMTSLRYTLVPIIASVRWQINDVGGPWIFRGNWDLTTSGAVTLIPRGPETRYFAWIVGVRRNFVPRRGKIAPYFDGRVGLGRIDAKAPAGVLYAQGQDFTFTVNLGSGARYNFNSRYSMSAGLNWMHISNLYISEPQFANYGINVYGPMFGLNVRLGRSRRRDSE